MIEIHKDDFTPYELSLVQMLADYYQRLRTSLGYASLDQISLYQSIFKVLKGKGLLIEDLLQAPEDRFLSEMHKIAFCVDYKGDVLGEDIIFKSEGVTLH